jgi:ABC transport system ATP-binding/permease protein
MPAPILTLQDVRLRIGDTELLDGVELFVEPGERLCIVGRNGAGKSTLLKIAAGMMEPDSGRRFLQPGITASYLPQEPDLSGYPDTLAYVAAGLSHGGDESRAYYLLGKLGLNGNEPIASLSGGQARRAALARVLAPRPDILMLDEPTNHLDLPAILWLEEELKAMKGALVLVSHDRRFLQNLSRATVWLDRGRSFRLDQGFGAFEAWRDKLLEEEEVERHRLDRKIAAEEHWVRYGVTARRKRNVRRMALLAGMRQNRREQRKSLGTVSFTVTEADKAGTCVIAAETVSKAYGDRAIVKDFSTRILRGDRIGIVGANGAGKTTLINLLTGKLKPDAGAVTIGANIVMAALEQIRALDPDKTLQETLTGDSGDKLDVGGERRHVMSYMKDFLFAPAQAKTPVSVLSGGERARLLLAKVLAKPANFLVLDEPTNDLDLETLDLLEELVDEYPGTVLLVSHDRDFLDRTVSAILFAEGDGRFVEYAGGYTDMIAQRGLGVTDKPAARKESKPAREKTAAKAKLTFSQQHELKTIPGEIEALEKTVAVLHGKLSDAGLYARDPAGFADLSAKLTEAETQRAALEERWLELELKREASSG